MPDRETVINIYANCILNDKQCCSGCYTGGPGLGIACRQKVLTDVLYLLKEQEEAVRCKDCAYALFKEGVVQHGHIVCTKPFTERWQVAKPDNWFCGDWERKEVNDAIKQGVCNMERRMFGQWMLFTDEPETEAGKVDYVSTAVEKLLHSMVGRGIVPDWGTVQIIIKEGFDIVSGPDWYGDEKEDYKGPYVGWAMTVGIKFYSENYPEQIIGGE